MKKIVYELNGGIAVVTASGEVEFSLVLEKDIPRIVNGVLVDWAPEIMPYKEFLTYPHVPYKIIEDTELPQDRQFRNAWKFDLKEDLEISKEIRKEQLREERKPVLESLDVEYTIADEEQDAAKKADIIKKKKADIIKKKKALRDITKLCDSCKTILELKQITTVQ